MNIDAVAEAICEANGVQKWAGIPQHHDYYRRMAQAAIDVIGLKHIDGRMDDQGVA